ncbi:MAG: hypothetical protein R2838_07305 [Caldilineaceae bacterium]
MQFNVETKRKPDNPAAIGDDFDGEHPGEFERTLVALIEEYGLDDRVIVQSFDHRSPSAVAQLNPTLRLALTAGGSAVGSLRCAGRHDLVTPGARRDARSAGPGTPPACASPGP